MIRESETIASNFESGQDDVEDPWNSLEPWVWWALIFFIFELICLDEQLIFPAFDMIKLKLLSH